MARVQIEPYEFTAIPRTREILKMLPEEIRVCSSHGEEITIQECDFSASPGGSAPFGKADWLGCCDGAINRVIKAVQEKTDELIAGAKRTYADKLAVKLEPEHKGEMVAIELGTNDYFVGEDEIEAADKARAAGHDGLLFFLRVGSPYAHRMMSPRQ